MAGFLLAHLRRLPIVGEQEVRGRRFQVGYLDADRRPRDAPASSVACGVLE
jgi:hypothetical protein